MALHRLEVLIQEDVFQKSTRRVVVAVVYADQFSGLSPYNYAANNPLYFVDPNGRFIFAALAAKVLLKGVMKKIGKKLIANAAKNAGVKAAKKIVSKNPFEIINSFVKGYKVGAAKAEISLNTAQTIGSLVGGGSNVLRNWDNITKDGGFDVLRAINYFYAGSVAGQLSALATPLATLTGVGLGGILNVEADLYQADGTLDREGGFWKSFSRGALSALTAKGISKSFLKGAGIKADPDWAQNWYTQGALGGAEKGTQTVFSNYNKYGPGAAKKFGRGFYAQSFLSGFAGGFVKGAGGFRLSKWEEKLNLKFKETDKYNFSMLSIGAISIGSDHTKKVIAKSINKEYKQYLSKSSGFDTPSIMNGFFQMFAYSAGK